MSTFHGAGGPHGLGLGPSQPRRGRRRRSADNDQQPALLDPARERDGKRIMRMFRPYRRRLGTVLSLIVFSSTLSMVSPFLLRSVLDTAIPHHNITLLTELVLGMIGVAVVTSALGVVQTYVSTDVGQRVMHDLRVDVYRHLQRLSLAFFTRTRAGEVQSRIANDIGGIDNVATSTAATI